MGTLKVDLRSGFDRDLVEIWIDEERRWRGEAVTTKFTLDLATSVPFEAADGPADVRIVLPDRGLEQSIEAFVADDTHVVVRVDADRLLVEQSAGVPHG